jgi:hypothetical protein
LQSLCAATPTADSAATNASTALNATSLDANDLTEVKAVAQAPTRWGWKMVCQEPNIERHLAVCNGAHYITVRTCMNLCTCNRQGYVDCMSGGFAQAHWFGMSHYQPTSMRPHTLY